MTRTAAQNATYPQKIACLIKLAADGGHPFICGICGQPILPSQAVQFDHTHAVGRGGQNRVEDLRPVHAANRGAEDAAGNPLDCHFRKTARPRCLATTIGGDTFEHHKTNRLSGLAVIAKRAPGEPRPKSAWRSRPFAKGHRPIPSRPMRRRA